MLSVFSFTAHPRYCTSSVHCPSEQDFTATRPSHKSGETNAGAPELSYTKVREREVCLALALKSLWT